MYRRDTWAVRSANCEGRDNRLPPLDPLGQPACRARVRTTNQRERGTKYHIALTQALARSLAVRPWSIMLEYRSTEVDLPQGKRSPFRSNRNSFLQTETGAIRYSVDSPETSDRQISTFLLPFLRHCLRRFCVDASFIFARFSNEIMSE